MGRNQAREVPGLDGFVGTANGTNVDGSIIVGRICRPMASRPSDPDFQSAWVWTRDGTQCLPAPRLRASPGPLIIVEGNATSDDGSVIGGSQAVASSPDSDAIIWIDRKPAYLKEFLQANGVPDAFSDVDQYGRDQGRLARRPCPRRDRRRARRLSRLHRHSRLEPGDAVSLAILLTGLRCLC